MRHILLAAVLSVTLPTLAHAGVILSPTAITASSNNASFGDPTVLINQGGLASGFTSGSTDFDSYIATNPQHTIFSSGAEWFSDFALTGATLNLDLGAAYVIESLAVWNDEFWGVGLIEVLTSLDNVTFTSLVSGLAPTDHALAPPGDAYGADVFGLAATNARFVRLELSRCPQPISASGGGCGLGEIAFEVTRDVVPTPAALGLFGLGVLALGAARRRG